MPGELSLRSPTPGKLAGGDVAQVKAHKSHGINGYTTIITSARFVDSRILYPVRSTIQFVRANRLIRRARLDMKIKYVFLLGAALLLAGTLFAQLPAASTGGPTLRPSVDQGPMTDKEVIAELKKDGAAALQKDLDKRGVSFEMDA